MVFGENKILKSSAMEKSVFALRIFFMILFYCYGFFGKFQSKNYDKTRYDGFTDMFLVIFLFWKSNKNLCDFANS